MPVTTTLRENTLRFWEGTFADLNARARREYAAKRWGAAIALLLQAIERAQVEGVDDEARLAEIDRLLREAYIAEGQRLTTANRFSEAAEIAAAGLEAFPDDVSLWHLLANARLELRLWPESIEALLRIRELEGPGRVDEPLVMAYLELVDGARKAQDDARMETALIEAIDNVPGSGILHFALGKLYAEWEAHDDAIRLLEEARRLDSSLADQADVLLGKIDDVLKMRDAVVIAIPPGSSTIRTPARVDGRIDVSFIVDTGATYTALPERIVKSLGYDLKRAEQVSVKTAAGHVRVRRIQLRSLDLQGYVVRNLDALVLPKSAGDVSLLGLNFLNFFRYEVDAKRGEFRLERQ